jgi:hypothetical protein
VGTDAQSGGDYDTKCRQVAKASETVAAAEAVGNAPNKMSFSEQLGGPASEPALQRGLIKLRPGPN